MTQDAGQEQAVNHNGKPDVRTQAAPVDGIPAEPGVLTVRPYPGFGQALVLTLLLVIAQAILAVPFFIAGLYRHPIALATPILIGTAVVVAYGFSKTGARFREVFPLSAVSIRVFLFLFIAIVGFFVLRLELAKFLIRIIPPWKGFGQLLRDMISAAQTSWIAFLILALVPPISEEFFFRGLILRGFLSRYGPKIAIIASALLFALMHGNPWQFATGLIMGILLAWCFVRTRSLVPCLFAHVLNNSIGLLLPRLQLNLPATTKWMSLHMVWVDTVGLVLAASGIYLLKRHFDAETVSHDTPEAVHACK